LNDFQQALHHVKGSVSADNLKQYEIWNQQFGTFPNTPTMDAD
jgi:hypothetical protein